MRHLYTFANAQRTLCGLGMGRVFSRTETVHSCEPVIHFSKARKTDCEDCRKAYRRMLKAARRMS